MRPVSAALLLLMLSTVLAAQTASRPAFDVVSVKRNLNPDVLPIVTLNAGTRFEAPNATVRDLIRNAWAIDALQIVGGPPWIAQTRYAVEATLTKPASTDDARLMLQTLLADRFQLRVRTEARETPVYALGRVSSAALGPKLRAAGETCVPIQAPPEFPPPPPPPPPGRVNTGRPLVAANAGLRCPVFFFPGWIAGRSITMPQFAARLAALVNRPVVDRTGLTGIYDFTFAYAPERPPVLAPGAPIPDTSTLPSIFTAVREELGLTLDATRAPVDVLVIESVQEPTEN